MKKGKIVNLIKDNLVEERSSFVLWQTLLQITQFAVNSFVL